MWPFKKQLPVEVSGFNKEVEVSPSIEEERMERHAAEQTKKSVKRMHRPHKSDAQLAGRNKILNLFHKVGIPVYFD